MSYTYFYSMKKFFKEKKYVFSLTKYLFKTIFSTFLILGRGGTAADAGDVVRAATWIREVYGRSMRVVHGFPLLAGGLVDNSPVRGLREVELWLAEVDKRRLASLPETSAFFTNTFLRTTSSISASINHRQALKLPLALHSSESGTFVSPGWEDLPRSLPSLGEKDEAAFRNVMLSELNVKFTLQLDPCPITDRSCQLATDAPEEERACMVLVGASHAMRLIDHLELANLTVVHSTVPGFRITDSSIGELAAELAERVSDLDPDNTVVVIQLLDNSVFKCLTEHRDRVLPKWGGGR
jgi:hypothetical protein